MSVLDPNSPERQELDREVRRRFRIMALKRWAIAVAWLALVAGAVAYGSTHPSGPEQPDPTPACEQPYPGLLTPCTSGLRHATPANVPG